MPKKESTLLRERWGTGYFDVVEPVLRRLLLEHDGLFPEVVDLRGVRLPDDKNHPSTYWFAHAANMKIQNIDFSYATLALSLARSALTRVAFDQAVLDCVNMDHAAAEHCSFRQAKIVANMDAAEFHACDFAGALFGATSSLKEFGGRRTRFIACSCDGARFRRVEFRASRFENCTFEGTRFESCDFRGARFDGSKPRSEQFESTCRLTEQSAETVA
jgi:uncharacterized protein YjbI with pentapeptide repeats